MFMDSRRLSMDLMTPLHFSVKRTHLINMTFPRRKKLCSACVTAPSNTSAGEKPEGRKRRGHEAIHGKEY